LIPSLQRPRYNIPKIRKIFYINNQPDLYIIFKKSLSNSSLQSKSHNSADFQIKYKIPSSMRTTSSLFIAFSSRSYSCICKAPWYQQYLQEPTVPQEPNSTNTTTTYSNATSNCRVPTSTLKLHVNCSLKLHFHHGIKTAPQRSIKTAPCTATTTSTEFQLQLLVSTDTDQLAQNLCLSGLQDSLLTTLFFGPNNNLVCTGPAYGKQALNSCG
jgi:hypothetical protein